MSRYEELKKLWDMWGLTSTKSVPIYPEDIELIDSAVDAIIDRKLKESRNLQDSGKDQDGN